MESDINTPLLSTDDSVNRRLYVEDDYSSDSSNSADSHQKKRRARYVKGQYTLTEQAALFVLN